MKQPSSFSTGDPSYLVVASTSGNVSPTALTISNPSVGSCFFGLRFIEASINPRATQFKPALCRYAPNGDARHHAENE